MSVVDDTGAPGGAKAPNAFVRLYRGETSFDFVGRRRWWYGISALVILAGIVSFSVKGFNWGIDFRGGTQWVVTAANPSVNQIQDVVSKAGVSSPTIEILGHNGKKTIQVQADLTKESQARQVATKTAVTNALARYSGVSPNKVSFSDIGPTWGSQITQKAIIAVIVFLVVVVAYISLRFEWKMAIAALIAVIHDLAVTAGIYSLTGFQVTPDTVIALLTILGYSLYDTVVVFDRVKDNSRNLTARVTMTYEDVVNLSMNQTLARSINTSLVAILPVLSVLVIGAQLLGATTLQYFGLALVIGLTSGAYSSIFIASPVLAAFKEREPRYASIRQKLATRADRSELLTPRQAAALAMAGGPSGSRSGGSGARREGTTGRRSTGVLRPGVAAQRSAAGAAGLEDEDVGDELDDGASAGAGNGRAPAGRSGGRGSAGAARGAGTARAAGGGARSGSGTGGRPAPRPRKGKGAKKGGRRR
ncbi:MAG TPA: protein translocase subunit SecF [Acidimicrobiales bacterium]|nr:protein translocase subunit SecF [Acidimicrobiales bacterium]